MKKDHDETVDETADVDLVLKDPHFDIEVQRHIEDSIAEGVKPHIAAQEKNVTKARFDAWYGNIPHFKEWIDFHIGKHLSERRRITLQKIYAVEDNAKAAQLNMQYLEKTDIEFGTKHQNITTNERQTVDPKLEKEEAQDFIGKHRLDGTDAETGESDSA